jgi:predicted transcriptional regulator of viral defense system
MIERQLKDVCVVVSRLRRSQAYRLGLSFDGSFDSFDAGAVLDLQDQSSRKVLAQLADAGLLTRLRRGLYVVAQKGEPDAKTAGGLDPWAVACQTLHPCYIGGWTACEYWGLAPRYSDEVYVVCQRRGAGRGFRNSAFSFSTHETRKYMQLGLTTIHRDGIDVIIADLHRTVIEVVANPRSAGGWDRAAEVVHRYFERPDADESLLLECADRLGRATAFKRLGYLSQQRFGTGSRAFTLWCKAATKKGVTSLDPAAPEYQCETWWAWGLRVRKPEKAIQPVTHEVPQAEKGYEPASWQLL